MRIQMLRWNVNIWEENRKSVNGKRKSIYVDASSIVMFA